MPWFQHRRCWLWWNPRAPAWRGAVFCCTGMPKNAGLQSSMGEKWPLKAAVPTTFSRPVIPALAAGHRPSQRHRHSRHRGLLWEAHQSHGHLPWARTLEPAIRLASAGFLPSRRMLRSIRLAQRFGVGHSPAFQALYLPGGQPPAADQPFRNPSLAKTLQLLAREGGPAFYQGPLAKQILDGVNTLQASAPSFRGWSPNDLSSYAVLWREPSATSRCSTDLHDAAPQQRGWRCCNPGAAGPEHQPAQLQCWRTEGAGDSWPAPRPGPMPTVSTGCTTPSMERSPPQPCWIRPTSPAGPEPAARQRLKANAGATPRNRSLSLWPAGWGHRTGHHPDHDRGRQRQYRLLHLLGRDDLRESAPGGRHGDEQSAHRFRLQAQPWRQTGRQPQPAWSSADVIDGANAGVPQRRAGAGPWQSRWTQHSPSAQSGPAGVVGLERTASRGRLPCPISRAEPTRWCWKTIHRCPGRFHWSR